MSLEGFWGGKKFRGGILQGILHWTPKACTLGFGDPPLREYKGQIRSTYTKGTSLGAHSSGSK